MSEKPQNKFSKVKRKSIADDLQFYFIFLRQKKFLNYMNYCNFARMNWRFAAAFK